MEINELKEIIKATFKKVYGTWHGEYKLVMLNESQNVCHITYIITQRFNGVIVEFTCSNIGVFNASSKGDLLQSPSEVKSWLTFIETIKETLRRKRSED